MAHEFYIAHSSDDYPVGIQYANDGELWCDSAATAYLMYKVNADPDLWQPSAIDKISGRKPGERTGDTSKSVIALLEQGAEIVEVRGFNFSRYKSEGKKYLEEYHATGWYANDPEGFDMYWSDEQVASDIQAGVDYYERIAQFKPQIQEVTEDPTLETIEDLLDQNYVVKCSIDPSMRKITCHSVVVTQINVSDTGDKTVRYFDNNLDGVEPTPFDEVPVHVFDQWLMPSNGILAVH